LRDHIKPTHIRHDDVSQDQPYRVVGECRFQTLGPVFSHNYLIAEFFQNALDHRSHLLLVVNDQNPNCHGAILTHEGSVDVSSSVWVLPENLSKWL